MTFIPTLAFVTLSLAATPGVAVSQTAAAPAAAATQGVSAEQAAPFLGDWTITAEGPQGPFVSQLTIKMDAGKVVAEISSEVQPKTLITDITRKDTTLVMKYSFDYQGNAIPAGLSVTPDGEKAKIVFDFADGQFTMAGTGVKKK